MMKTRILCVHTSGAVLHELEETLTETGCEVLLAEDADQAERILKDEHVDGVVLSYDIEDAEGRVLRNQVRHVNPEMPVLLFSDMSEIRNVPLHVFSDYLQHQDLPALVGGD